MPALILGSGIVLAVLAVRGLEYVTGGLIGMAAGGQAFITYQAYAKFLATSNENSPEKLRLTIVMMTAFALKVITIAMGFRLQSEWGNPASMGLAVGLLWVYFAVIGWLMAADS
ncbi:MAG: hypothetical protein JNJ45_03000 [Chthonomonas sp.]|nr:hypothetical protein [Chthonomonas sp.]